MTLNPKIGHFSSKTGNLEHISTLKHQNVDKNDPNHNKTDYIKFAL